MAASLLVHNRATLYTITYNPGSISESVVGAYYDLGADFYNLSFGLEFLSISSQDEFTSDGDRIALTIGLELFN